MSLIGTTDVKRVAVVGSGTIGASWAAWFLARGLAVNASDPAPAGETFVRDFVRKAWPQLEALGQARGTLDEALARLRFTADPAESCRDADMVQENAPERLDIKRAVLAQIDAALPAERVICSSTSGLTPSDLQAGLANPERLVVAHPFNPPHLIPLVEIVGGSRTTPEAVAWALDFYNHHGKRAIHVRKEVPGHIANRLQAALWREAAHLVASGVASVKDVDIAITEGPGIRWALMGPHLTFHLAGGEQGIEHFARHLGPAMTGWWKDLGSPVIDEPLTQLLAEGIREEVSGHSVGELAAERDRLLIELLRTVKSQDASRLW